MKWKLVYFDDQSLSIECYQEFLKEQFDVLGIMDPMAYSDVIKNHSPHIFLIDVHMPLINGHELAERILEHPLYNSCPIIFISADETHENKIQSFQKGGVDFISRSLDPQEIKLRLINKVKFFVEQSGYFQLGNLHLQMKILLVSINNKPIDLTLIEFRLLGHILRAYPQVLTRGDLLEKVWEDELVRPGTINTHLTNLKSKIAKWNYLIKVREENVLVLPRDGSQNL
jgi:DNA-binding response OmpR family regulator